MFASAVQLLTPTLAYADTKSDIHDMNYKYYAAIYLRDCIYHRSQETFGGKAHAALNTVSQSVLDDSSFLKSNNKLANGLVNIGRYFERDDGVAGCEEREIVKSAMASLGYGDNPGKLLTDIGYTYDSANKKYIRRADGTDDMNTKVVAKYGQTAYAKYAALEYIFNNDTSDRGKCELIEPPNGAGGAVVITYKKVVKNDNGDWGVQDTQAQFQTAYTANNMKTNYDYKGGASKGASCKELRAEMDGLVGAVVLYNNSHKDDPMTDDLLGGGSDDCNESSPAWNKDTESCADEDTPICSSAIGPLGWAICPAMNLMASVADSAYGFLASHFLQVDTKLVSDKTKDAWAKFRDIANIAFVIALMLVIYSQLTSVGITNYGIKKLLPKIIVAALLVNLSFVVCQVAVDISNIAGYGINQFFEGINLGNKIDSGSTYAAVTDAQGNPSGWVIVVGAILVAGVLGIAIAVGGAVLFAAVLAIGMIVLILVARQALIVLLVIISPLAFVAYLLPNTEQWFKKWWKMFSTLLLLFPIIGIVFGASKLAGGVLYEAAGDDLMLRIVALGVTAIPFFVVPGLLKGAINAAGAIGGKLSGIADKAGKRASSRAGKKLNERWENTDIARGLAAGKAARATARKAKYAGRINKGGIGAWSAKAGAVAGGGGAGLKSLNRSALTAASEEETKDVQAAKLEMQKQSQFVDASGKKVNLTNSNELEMAKIEFQRAMARGDSVKARAAQSIMTNSGSAGLNTLQKAYEELGNGGVDGAGNAISGVHGLNYGDTMKKEAGQKVLSDLNTAGLKSKNIVLDKFSREGAGTKISDVRDSAATYSSLTAAEFVGQSPDNIKVARRNGGLSQEMATAIQSTENYGQLDSAKMEQVRRAALGDTSA